MKFTKEHYAMSEMIDIVNSNNNFVHEGKFDFEQYYFFSMPSQIRERQRLGWYVVPLLDADYFSEHKNDRIHFVVKDMRDGKVPTFIAKDLIDRIKKIHNSKTCEKCSGDGWDDGRLKIPSLENIDITYRKENGLPLEVENR